MKALRYFTIILTIFFCNSIEVFSETEVVFSDDFETDKGWAVDPYGTDDATTGMWERANPEGTYYQLDVTPGTGWNDLVTGPLAGSNYGSYDIDNGKTSIRSPDITLPENISITLTFKYYLAHASNSSSSDYLRVKVVDDSDNPHVVFEELGASDTDYPSWEDAFVDISEFNGQTIYLLIEAADESEASLVEAGVDDVLIEKGAECMPEPTCYRGEFWLWSGLDMYNRHHRTNAVGIGCIPTQDVKLEVGEASYFRERIGIGIPPEGDKALIVNGLSKFNGKVGIGASPNPADLENLQVNGEIKVYDPGLPYKNQLWPGMIKIGDGTNSVMINHEQIEITQGANAFYINPDAIGAKAVICEDVTTDLVKTDQLTTKTSNKITVNEKMEISQGWGDWLRFKGTKTGDGTWGIHNPGSGNQTPHHLEFYFDPPGGASGDEKWNVLVLNTNGNVGIGTNDPGEYKLAVNGNIKAKEIVVTQLNWSDFVFEKGYDLKPLEELEKFIEKNKHLPNIPTENEVKEKGLSIGDIQAKLLEKIEEMTLYIIQLQKRINELESEKK